MFYRKNTLTPNFKERAFHSCKKKLYGCANLLFCDHHIFNILLDYRPFNNPIQLFGKQYVHYITVGLYEMGCILRVKLWLIDKCLKFSALCCSCHKNLVPFTQNNSLPRLRNKDTEKKRFHCFDSKNLTTNHFFMVVTFLTFIKSTHYKVGPTVCV